MPKNMSLSYVPIISSRGLKTYIYLQQNSTHDS